MAYTDNGREFTGVEVIEWAEELEEFGAGEILLTSVDNEGTGKGYDMNLIKLIADKVSIPLIVHGGPGKLEHIYEAVAHRNVDAVAVASILHYDFIKSHKSLSGYEEEGNIEFLKSGKKISNIQTAGIREIKNYLISKYIDCRPANC